MNNAELFAQCEVAARAIVQGVKEQYPNGEGIVAISFGGGSGSSNQDTSFARSGTSQTDAQRVLSSALSTLIDSNASTAQVSSTAGLAQQNLLTNLMQRDTSVVPGQTTLTDAQAVNPTNFAGKTSLDNMAGVDPTSSTYETNTADSFMTRLKDSLAEVRSGATNVRGGTARQGFREAEAIGRANLERSEELRRAKLADAGMVNQAVQTSQSAEGARRGQTLQAQGQQMAGVAGQEGKSLGASEDLIKRGNINNANIALAAEMLGLRRSTNTENLTGKGSQSGSNSAMQWGVGCCFIFMQAYNGELPWFVRESRDYFYTPRRREGYTRMSLWLVPLMRKSKLASLVVNWLMIKPLTSYGGWFWQEKGYKLGWLFKPVVSAWFKTWEILGKV